MIYQIFNLVFMPIFTRYSENDVLFHSLFTKKILKDFLETFF